MLALTKGGSMPLAYIAQIKNRINEPEKTLTANSQVELEARVVLEIATWSGIIVQTATASKISVVTAGLLIVGSTCLFWPSTAALAALLVTYHKIVVHERNPLAHRWFAQRHKKAWEAELTRIQNLDSRLPYKNLPSIN
jgi:hypothetical protein